MRNKPFDGESHKRLTMQALILLGIATFLGGAFVFYYVVSLPYIGFEFSGGTTVGAVAPDSPAAAAGLRVGDRIVAINSIPPMSSGEIYLRPDQDSLLFEVVRDGQSLLLEIRPTSPSRATILDKVGYFSVAVGFWLVAMLVLIFKPRDAVARIFVLVTLLGTAVLVVWPLADLGTLWANLLMDVLVAIIGPIFVHYHTLFPERSHFKGSRALLVSLYGIGALLAVLSLSLDAIYYTGFYKSLGVEHWPSAALAIKAYFSLCLLIGLALLVRTYLLTETESSKRQIALVVLGTALALLPLIVLVVIPQILFSHYLIPSWIPLLMLGFSPASYLYATYRHDLMKLDRVVNRSVAYFVLSLMLVLIYLGLEWGIRSLTPATQPLPVTLADVIPVLVLLLAFQPLKRRIELLVDRLFYGGWYNYESFTLEMSQALNEAVNLETVIALLTENAAQTMRLKEIALLLPTDDDDCCVRASRGFVTSIPDCPTGMLTELLRELGKPTEHRVVLRRLQSEPGAQEALKAYSEAGVQMWVPLVQQGELNGLLLLGNKVADEFYTQNDHAILLTLAHQAAAALARARLVGELQVRMEEVQALSRRLLALQERNQQRMALELHDQAVQDLHFVRQLLDSALKDASPAKIEGARDELLRIVGYLDSLIFELRPPELEQGELGQILSKYAATFQRTRRLPVAFQAKGTGNDISVPEEVKLVLYRIFQESLNNARKHAEARQVEARLDVRSDEVKLQIRDDGKGFEVPKHLANWIDNNRLGLVGMWERAADVGGSFFVESQPSQGTLILVKVPLCEA